MKNIILKGLELKTFTKQDALDYCSINNINPLEVNLLKFVNNELTDISGIKLFKNLKKLQLYNNMLKDISVVSNLINLEYLDINQNMVKNLNNIKNLNKLKILCIGFNPLDDISVIQYLNNLETLDIRGLKLESNQIEYINSLKNLNLWYKNGFKDMNILKQVNKNIRLCF